MSWTRFWLRLKLTQLDIMTVCGSLGFSSKANLLYCKVVYAVWWDSFMSKSVFKGSLLTSLSFVSGMILLSFVICAIWSSLFFDFLYRRELILIVEFLPFAYDFTATFLVEEAESFLLLVGLLFLLVFLACKGSLTLLTLFSGFESDLLSLTIC